MRHDYTAYTSLVISFAHPAIDINECDNDPCAPDAECRNLPGTHECVCSRGYLGDGMTCTEENECATGRHLCTPRSQCINTVGSYICQCLDGYRMAEKRCVGEYIMYQCKR